MKRKKPFKRNLFLLGIMVAVFLVLVIGIQFLQPEIVYLDYDEMVARNAIRQDPTQNGWYDLKAAMALLPPRPDPPKEINQTVPGIFGSIDDSIGSFLGLHLPESHPIMLEYVEECRPAFERAAFALDKPTMLTERPRLLNWHFYTENTELGLERLFKPMTAAVRMDFLYNDNPKRGAATLLLLIKLQQRCEKDLVLYSGSLISGTRSLIDNLIIHAGSPEHLDYLEDVVKQTKDTIAKPEVYLSRWFNVLDNTIHFPTTPESKNSDFDLEDRFFMWQLSKSINFMWNYLPLFDELMEVPATEQLDYFLNYKNDNVVYADSLEKRMPDTLILDLKYYFFTDAMVNLGQMDLFQAHFEKYSLMFALQRFHTDHGTYPQTANELMPKYLDVIPLSPVSNTPFRYQKEGLGYTMVGDGYKFLGYGKSITPAKELEFIKEMQFEPWPSRDEETIVSLEESDI